METKTFENSATFQIKRPACLNCKRPSKTCWCPYLPKEPLSIRYNILIIQHPCEEKRKIQTSRIIELGLDISRVYIHKTRKVTNNSPSHVIEMCRSPYSILLYPSCDAVSLSECPRDDKLENIVLIDGTWPQARGIYMKSPMLKSMKKYCIEIPSNRVVQSDVDEFAVRTQPNLHCVSTVEAVVHALNYFDAPEAALPTILRPVGPAGVSGVNSSGSIRYGDLTAASNSYDCLLEPLRALCAFQMAQGTQMEPKVKEK